MRFGKVLDMMKAEPGTTFAREGWNGRDMYIFLMPGGRIDPEDWTGPVECIRSEDVMQDDGTVITEHYVLVNDYLCMKTADGSVVYGWLASQTDMLADDWYQVA